MHNFLKNHKKLNLAFWFPESTDNNDKSQQGTWNGLLAVANKTSSFGQLTSLVVQG